MIMLNLVMVEGLKSGRPILVIAVVQIVEIVADINKEPNMGSFYFSLSKLKCSCNSKYLCIFEIYVSLFFIETVFLKEVKIWGFQKLNLIVLLLQY